MTITGIQPLDKKRSRVWLDGEFAFVLYKGELRTYKVEEGKELSQNDYEEITRVILPKRAKLRIMNLLKSHTYSVNQLRDKLIAGEYPGDVIDEALQYVAQYGYTDDLRLSEEYIRIHIDEKSRQRLVQDLSRKGISKDVIIKAFDNCSEYGFEQNELAMAVALLKKRGFDPDAEYEDSTARMKAFAREFHFLARKGYSSAVIRRAMGGFEME